MSTWAYDDLIERTRQNLASDNALMRGLAQKSLERASTEAATLGAAIADYESRLRAHIAAGNPLPDGVLAPEAPAAPNPQQDRADFAHEVIGLLTRQREPEPAPAWVPDERMEMLRRYQASTDDRERAVAGQHAKAVRDYEAGLRAHLAAGNPLPRGVQAPLRDVPAGGNSWSADPSLAPW